MSEFNGNVAYILQCGDGTFYCGWTNDIVNRIKTHNSGKGGKYTRARLPVKLVYYEEFPIKEEAMSREWHLKHLSRKDKEELINGADSECINAIDEINANADA